jgi:DNA-binding NtrC family response regulator
MMAKILVIDDDVDFGELVAEQVRKRNHRVMTLDCAEEGLKLLSKENHGFNLVIVDNMMPRMNGLEFLAEYVSRSNPVPVVLMTGSPSDKTAIQAMKIGAFDYVVKPIEAEAIMNELRPIIEEAVRLIPPKEYVPPDLNEKGIDLESAIVGRSKAIQDVFKLVGRCARQSANVLITGETGTGKDLVARAIHTNSAREKKPFVVINCTALTDTLLDDELFGHEPNAFTGAPKLRKGRFEHAHGGTLFLDEVGDMPLAFQAKLLRVLQNREITRVGSNDPIKVDVRVLAATHRDLDVQVHKGEFREDLKHRLDGLRVHVPPLRERKDDIELLVQRFLYLLAGNRLSGLILDPEALELLKSYHWPGNVRELEQVLCRAVGACRGSRILPNDLDFGRKDGAKVEKQPSEEIALAGLHSAIAWLWQNHETDVAKCLQEEAERELIHFVLSQPSFTKTWASKKLGIARNTLDKLLERHAPNRDADNVADAAANSSPQSGQKAGSPDANSTDVEASGSDNNG